MKYELQNIISGECEVIYGNAIQAIANYLKRSTRASKLVEESEFFREQETEILITYIPPLLVFFTNNQKNCLMSDYQIFTNKIYSFDCFRKCRWWKTPNDGGRV